MKPALFWTGIAACVAVGCMEAIARTLLDLPVPRIVRRVLRDPA